MLVQARADMSPHTNRSESKSCYATLDNIQVYWSMDPTIGLPGESHGRTAGYGVLLLQWIALLCMMY